MHKHTPYALASLVLLFGTLPGVAVADTPAFNSAPSVLPSPTPTRQAPTAADFDRLNNQNRNRSDAGSGQGGGQRTMNRESGQHSGGGSGQQRRYGGGR